MVALLSRAILMNCQRLGNCGLPRRKDDAVHERAQQHRVRKSAGQEHPGDEIRDRADVTAKVPERAAGFDDLPAAAAVTQRVAIIFRRARAFPVAAVGPANGNIIVRRPARGIAPRAADDRMFARVGLFHDDSICTPCDRLISDHT
jgi:hypothetical protein